jgi:aldehyde:ferredoxin oxidoreductase
MDLRQRGILPDAELDGQPVEFGNGRAVLASPDAVAFRRGLGDVLAEGSVRAATTLGGAEHLTAVRGQELAMHDPRQRTEYGKQVRISYATSPTGGDHMNSNLPSRSAKNTVGMCFFLRYDDPKLTDIVNAVTGWGLDAAGLADIGELSLTLARLFNNREGFGSADDVLPEQAMKPHVSGVLSRVRLDADDVAEQVRAYYRSRGWSDNGVPTPETLAKHGLTEYDRA